MTTTADDDPYLETPAERWANVATHGAVTTVAAAACAILLTQLVALADARRIVAGIVYAVGLLALYGASTAYHSVVAGTAWKRRLRRIDHAAIYVFIAGSYTPVLLVPLRGGWGWSLLVVVWTTAVVGCYLKLFRFRGDARWSTLLYLLMGWVGFVAIVPICRTIALPGVVWILGGGVCYSAGVAFYAMHRLRFHHAIWHGFVAAGSVCHFIAIGRYVLG